MQIARHVLDWGESVRSLAGRHRHALLWTIAGCAAVSAAGRHTLLYSIAPYVCIALILERLAAIQNRARLPHALPVAILLLSALSHIYNIAAFGVNPAFDSGEYLGYASAFARGEGLRDLLYRAPLYPILAGLLLRAGGDAGLLIVIVQHALALGCLPLMAWLCRRLGWPEKTSVLALTMFALNAFVMQACSFIMTEIVFMFCALLCVVVCVKVYEYPRIWIAAAAGAMAAVAAHVREMILPFLLAAAVAVLLRWRRTGVAPAATAIGLYLLLLIPWSARNYVRFDRFALSAHFGVNVYTKARSFNLEDRDNAAFAAIAPVLTNVHADLGVPVDGARGAPEDDWRLNRVPHALIDSMIRYHGYEYSQASDLLADIAVASFLARPIRYVAAVIRSFRALLCEHHDLYPEPRLIAPALPRFAGDAPMRKLATGVTFLPGALIALFPLVAAGSRRRADWLPFAVVCGAYAMTAAVQIGFTRYTIPWTPFAALCAAYVITALADAVRNGWRAARYRVRTLAKNTARGGEDEARAV
jgi:hypothetical protein